MKEDFEINLLSRDDSGKGASRRLRLAGLVPGIVYGGGKDPQMVKADHNSLAHHLENEAFYSHILSITVGDDKKQKVVLKDLQRHPSKPFVMHFDFLRVSDTDQLKMHVPLHFIGEEDAPGTLHGGNLVHSMTDVEIICEARNLPEYIEVDISGIDLGEILHLSQITLPEGVEILALTHGDEHDAPVVTISAPKVVEEEDTEAPVAPSNEDESEESDED